MLTKEAIRNLQFWVNSTDHKGVLFLMDAEKHIRNAKRLVGHANHVGQDTLEAFEGGGK